MLSSNYYDDPFNVLLTTLQLAARWAMAEATLRNWRVLGMGPPFIRVGRNVRYRLSVILAWEADREADSTTATPTTPGVQKELGR
jgi:hypothetical protein